MIFFRIENIERERERDRRFADSNSSLIAREISILITGVRNTYYCKIKTRLVFKESIFDSERNEECEINMFSSGNEYDDKDPAISF